MDLTDSNGTVTLISAITIVVGVVGVLVPVLPGLLLCWLGVLFWALFADAGAGRWLVLALATGIALVGVAVKYLWPGRNLKRSGVPNSSLLAGGLLGLIGFFVVPVIGLVLGFVLGVWLAERRRFGDGRLAWPSTRQALFAAGLAMLVELGTGLAIAAVWVAGLLLV